jgi:hypothetical protein
MLWWLPVLRPKGHHQGTLSRSSLHLLVVEIYLIYYSEGFVLTQTRTEHLETKMAITGDVSKAISVDKTNHKNLAEFD